MSAFDIFCCIFVAAALSILLWISGMIAFS